MVTLTVVGFIVLAYLVFLAAVMTHIGEGNFFLNLLFAFLLFARLLLYPCAALLAFYLLGAAFNNSWTWL